VTCGNRDQICCTDPNFFPYPCFEPNTCQNGSCVACGYTGQPCCGGFACGTGQKCDPATMTCQPG
jgi:hypothetical protein